MLKRLIAAALLCMIAVPAWAAMNLRQSGDGTAHWQGKNTETFNNCAGGVHIDVPVSLGEAGFQYLPIPISNAVIKGVWGVAAGTSAGTSHVKVYVNGTTHAIEFYDAADSDATDAQLTFSTASAGTTARISTVGEVRSAWSPGAGTVLASNTTLNQGGVAPSYLAVGSDGGGTTATATASVMIQVCPR